MKNRVVCGAIAAFFLGTGVSSFAAGGGNGGSHGGGSSAGSGRQQSHGPDSKPANPPAHSLGDNKKLSFNLTRLLPEGTVFQDASAGFKNMGQFVAAVHLCKNLSIPFADLKAKIMMVIASVQQLNHCTPSPTRMLKSRKLKSKRSKISKKK
jgi:hypothetical protein